MQAPPRHTELAAAPTTRATAAAAAPGTPQLGQQLDAPWRLDAAAAWRPLTAVQRKEIGGLVPGVMVHAATFLLLGVGAAAQPRFWRQAEVRLWRERWVRESCSALVLLSALDAAKFCYTVPSLPLLCAAAACGGGGPAGDCAHLAVARPLKATAAHASPHPGPPRLPGLPQLPPHVGRHGTHARAAAAGRAAGGACGLGAACCG